MGFVFLIQGLVQAFNTRNDFVITGEGRTDFQTAFGKAPVGVAKVAKQFGVPVFCLSGGPETARTTRWRRVSTPS